MDKRIEVLKEIFGLESKEVEWGIIEENIIVNGDRNTEREPGLYIKDSRVFVNLYERRFYTIIDRPEIKRAIHPATLSMERKTNLSANMSQASRKMPSCGYFMIF